MSFLEQIDTAQIPGWILEYVEVLTLYYINPSNKHLYNDTISIKQPSFLASATSSHKTPFSQSRTQGTIQKNSTSLWLDLSIYFRMSNKSVNNFRNDVWIFFPIRKAVF